MLSLGPGSSCDICFESFNATSKAPSSIACGHVFCSACIVKISRLCPLCRCPFDSRSIIKLHIELENAPDSRHCSAENLQKAKELTSLIFKIADEGITETGLRDLIKDGRAFLHGQDRALHRDLRVLLRLISYLNEVKITSRAQTQAVEMLTAQVEGLEKEKEDIRNLLADNEATRQMERDTALAVEASLRGHITRIQEHCNKATSAYLALVQLYNKISLHNKELINQLTNAGLSAGPFAEIYQADNLVSSDPSSVDLIAPLIDKKSLQGIAVRNPKSSYLISPLPQFTSALPNVSDSFLPLPDLADDNEEEDEQSTDEDEEEGLSTPDSATQQSRFQDYPARSATMPESLPPPIKAYYEASGISRSAPYVEHHRRARSRSNPVERMPLHRKYPYDSNIAPPTRPPTPPYPSEAHEEYAIASRDAYPSSSESSQQPRQSTSQSYNQYSSRHHDTPEYPGTPMPMNEDRLSSRLQANNNNQADPLLRLQSILSSDSQISSSLPSMTSRHFPPSYTSRDQAPPPRDRHTSPPPRSGSSGSHNQTPTPQTSQQPQPQHQPQHQHHHQQQNQQQQQTQQSSSDDKGLLLASSLTSTSSVGKPSVSPSISTTKVVSTASAHAQKLEDEKRRKYEDEKRRRQQEERYQAEERERYQHQQQQEYDARYASGAPGTKYVSASAAAASASASAANNSNGNNINAVQVPRRDQQMYGPNMQMSSSPSGPTVTNSSSKRGSTSSASNIPNAYGRMQSQLGSTYDHVPSHSTGVYQ